MGEPGCAGSYDTLARWRCTLTAQRVDEVKAVECGVYRPYWKMWTGRSAMLTLWNIRRILCRRVPIQPHPRGVMTDRCARYQYTSTYN